MSNLTTSQNLSPGVITYYDRKLLENARPHLAYYQFAKHARLPRNAGKTHQFRRWGILDTIAPGAAPLTEGTTPTGQDMSQAEVLATVAGFGGFIEHSDLLDLTFADSVVKGAVEELGAQGGRTINGVIGDTIAKGTNVYFGGTSITQRSALDAADKLTVDLIRRAVRFLKGKDAPRFVRNGKEYYIAVVHPDAVYDLQSDQLWQDVSKYSAAEQIFDGELGKLFGVIFIESTQAHKFEGGNLFGATTKLTVASITGKAITIDEALTAGDLEADQKILVGNFVYTVASMTAGAAGAAVITIKETPTVAPVDGDIITAGGGHDGTDVYSTLVFGRNAYATTAIDGDGNPNAIRTIIKPKGSAGSTDPLEQRGTVAWKVDAFATAILNNDWLIRLETGASQ